MVLPICYFVSLLLNPCYLFSLPGHKIGTKFYVLITKTGFLIFGHYFEILEEIKNKGRKRKGPIQLSQIEKTDNILELNKLNVILN
jgi:hypothetical protein